MKPEKFINYVNINTLRGDICHSEFDIVLSFSEPPERTTLSEDLKLKFN